MESLVSTTICLMFILIVVVHFSFSISLYLINRDKDMESIYKSFGWFFLSLVGLGIVVWVVSLNNNIIGYVNSLNQSSQLKFGISIYGVLMLILMAVSIIMIGIRLIRKKRDSGDYVGAFIWVCTFIICWVSMSVLQNLSSL